MKSKNRSSPNDQWKLEIEEHLIDLLMRMVNVQARVIEVLTNMPPSVGTRFITPAETEPPPPAEKT
jgi:hypothetical protein